MNKNLFRSVMIEHGDNYDSLSKAMQITTSALCNKINEKTGNGFTQPEILAIKKRYNLSPSQIDEIFFSIEVSWKDTQISPLKSRCKNTVRKSLLIRNYFPQMISKKCHSILLIYSRKDGYSLLKSSNAVHTNLYIVAILDHCFLGIAWKLIVF